MQKNGKLYSKVVGYDTTTGERIVKIEFDVKNALKRSSSPNTWAHEVVKSMFEEEMRNPTDLECLAKGVLEEVSKPEKPLIAKRIPSNESRYQKNGSQKKSNFNNLKSRTKSLPIRRVKKTKRKSECLGVKFD